MFDSGNPYFKCAQLLVRILPHIATVDCFALKGGTAINFFIRDLPRLSVDVDLAYVPVEDRTASLSAITSSLQSIANRIRRSIADSSVNEQKDNEGNITKLVIRQGALNVKVEVSPVLRGLLYPPEKMSVSRAVEETLGYVKALVVTFDELYTGKLCAALDRQHPRDLFDIMILLNKEGITDSLKKVFLVYLLCDNRPIAELLHPNKKDLTEVFETQFKKMTKEPVLLGDLLKTRDKLFQKIIEMLSDDDKRFLLSFKQGAPNWGLLGLDNVKDFPAVRWKLYNLNKMKETARKDAVKKLEKILYE